MGNAHVSLSGSQVFMRDSTVFMGNAHVFVCGSQVFIRRSHVFGSIA
jgi:hypothetical protein